MAPVLDQFGTNPFPQCHQLGGITAIIDLLVYHLQSALAEAVPVVFVHVLYQLHLLFREGVFLRNFHQLSGDTLNSGKTPLLTHSSLRFFNGLIDKFI